MRRKHPSDHLIGETLRTRLERGRLSLEDALEYALQLSSGLAAVHDAGIILRSLTPEEVFITADSSIKIVDFRLGKLLPHVCIASQCLIAEAGEIERKTQRGRTLDGASYVMPDRLMGGAPADLRGVPYLSPEQMMGVAAGRPSDVFTFGSILYEMLSGTPAFSGSNVRAIGIAILTNEVPPVKDAPVALDEIVRRCLRKEPEDRFESGYELERALKALHP
jgi:serine/threonine protein kinase